MWTLRFVTWIAVAALYVLGAFGGNGYDSADAMDFGSEVADTSPDEGAAPIPSASVICFDPPASPPAAAVTSPLCPAGRLFATELFRPPTARAT